jgi:hypothetical protein
MYDSALQNLNAFRINILYAKNIFTELKLKETDGSVVRLDVYRPTRIEGDTVATEILATIDGVEPLNAWYWLMGYVDGHK